MIIILPSNRFGESEDNILVDKLHKVYTGGYSGYCLLDTASASATMSNSCQDYTQTHTETATRTQDTTDMHIKMRFFSFEKTQNH